MKKFKQIAACPSCRRMAGWYSPFQRGAVAIYGPQGNIKVESLRMKPIKHCANCDRDITRCVEVAQ